MEALSGTTARPRARNRARSAALAGACLLACGCGGALPGPPEGPAAVPPPALADVALPLPLGFYVGSGTPCADASNATLVLLHRDGLNWARAFCRFDLLERTGPFSFRAAERCVPLGADEEGSSVVDWEILGPTTFRRSTGSGWVAEFRFCEQATLPQPWRENDLSGLIG